MMSTIYYGSKTVELGRHWRQRVDPQPRHTKSQTFSGIEERLNVRLDLMVSVGFRYYLTTTDSTVKRNVQQWFTFAQEGGAWYFAIDSAEKVLTTLATSPLAGASSFDVVDPAGVTIGKQFVIRNKGQMQVVLVTNVSANTISIAEPLDNDFFAHDRFRSEFYWPGRLQSENNVLLEHEPIWWDLNLEFIEDVQSL